ncbi:PREDICTED: uncharacterized protein LOC105557298 [Vollenhovia emeryi]|uniref:uncharacterized protein LOC105557298 n=1 Tax=Vollenhovia emeryi TaxID=411798 RepID=UPI0005F43A3C|nr:PREDICTED: uncharacterized protein LOC105557298 [Vollenhovia emeryi]
MFNLSLKFQRLKDKRKRKIWQLFRATDFASLMYPCFTVCRLMGLFSYKFNASNIKTYKPSYILSTFVMCVFCTAYSINFYDVIIAGNIRFKSAGVPKKLELMGLHIFGGFIVITTFIFTGPRMRLLRNIMEVSLKLPPQSFQNLSRLIHAKDSLFSLFLIVNMCRFYYVMNIAFLRKIMDVYMVFFVYQMDMLYVNCVCILKACFKQINDNLVNLRDILRNGEPCLLSGTYRAQTNPFILLEITALKKQHLAISDTVRMLTSVFSLHLVSTLLMDFANVIFTMYEYFVVLIHKSVNEATNSEKEVVHKFVIVLITYHMIKVVLIVWACETGKNQALAIKTTVRDVFNNTNNEQTKYELELFSLQVLHCENVFSAKWIIIDATLFKSLIGNITTYLLILVQFLYMANSCVENLSN